MSKIDYLLGVDTGGTFTDFVLFGDGKLRIHKVLSTPKAPERAILHGITELGLDITRLQVIHGSTVATNAVLEGKGVSTAFITNRGLGDMLTLGRQARKALYDLQPALTSPPVAQAFCLETGGRMSAQGDLLDPLNEQDLQRLAHQISELKPRSVAINLLFSFLDSDAEKRIEAHLNAAFDNTLFVCRSSDVLPEFKEYERGMATWLNAYIGPLMEGYLHRLSDALSPAPVAVMQSSGGTLSAGVASRYGVHLLLSGPAGGLTGAKHIAKGAGIKRLLTFDMGGTSTDVALIEGDIRLTNEGHIGDYPVAVPMVDMHTIGAGGGSIAYVDQGGMLQVGPESAGADPGPACYGKGGKSPTVTDANLILGRLRSNAFLGGRIVLEMPAAQAAIEPLAKHLKLTVTETAEGIIDIANEHMARALRVISVQRGMDPRDFCLASFGGAGGLHACALAENLGMKQILVPIHAGVLSALGMLAASPARQLSRTHTGVLSEQMNGLDTLFIEMEQQGRLAMEQEGLTAVDIESTRRVDLRYLGQSYTLNIPWQGQRQSEAAFHQQHKQRYGHRLDEPVELVNLRVTLRGPDSAFKLTAPSHNPPSKPVFCALHGINTEVPIYNRDNLVRGQVLNGPALVTETVSTTYIAPDWRCEVDIMGNMLLKR